MHVMCFILANNYSVCSVLHGIIWLMSGKTRITFPLYFLFNLQRNSTVVAIMNTASQTIVLWRDIEQVS